jgi:hypothetical protein
MSTEVRIEGRQVAEALQRVLSSRTFARSERLRAFLKFVVEMEQLGLAHQLKGYTIGIDVFSRNHGFDPGTDPLVRVQAGKLRKLLNQFYASEGRDDPLRIRMPTGAYVPIYERQDRDPDDTEDEVGNASNEVITGFRQDTNVLPHLFLRQPAAEDERARILVNAVRLWRSRLWAITIASLEERPRLEGSAPDLLHFELHAQSDEQGSIRLRLSHLYSGREVKLSQSIWPTSGDILELGVIANQFAGANLTIPGSIYRFCRENGLSTGQMQCLDATYRYSLERTDAAYISARDFQQQWAGLSHGSDIITEIPKLIAQSAMRA